MKDGCPRWFIHRSKMQIFFFFFKIDSMGQRGSRARARSRALVARQAPVPLQQMQEGYPKVSKSVFEAC